MSIQEIIATVVNKYKNNIDKAVDEAELKIRRLKEFEEFQRELVRGEIRNRIHDERHKVNTSTRNKATTYGPAKVVVGKSNIVRSTAQEWFDYYIGSKTLGSLLGSELASLAEAEKQRATGYLFNSHLLSALSAIVPENKTVRGSVSPKQLLEVVARAKESVAA